MIGKYDYTYFPRNENERTKNLFLFDTGTGEVTDFETEGALASVIHINVHLTPTQFFHGSRPKSEPFLTFLFLLILFASPAAAAVWLIRHIWRLIKSPLNSPQSQPERNPSLGG